jgi:predicted kinase
MTLARTGSDLTKLIIIRGNSGSGKSTVATMLRHGYGRGCALVEQDYLRRIVLRERDKPGGLAAGLIEQTVRYALDGGYHVVLEGILHRAKYGPMLASLLAAHRGQSHVFYLDVSFAETLRRHATRPLAAHVTAEQMTDWYANGDVLGGAGEHRIDEASSQQDTVAFIARTAGLALDERDDDIIAPASAPIGDAAAAG